MAAGKIACAENKTACCRFQSVRHAENIVDAMLSVAVCGDNAGKIRKMLACSTQSGAQSLALSTIAVVMDNDTAERSAEVKNRLGARSTAVINDNELCHAALTQLRNQRAKALVRIERGDENGDIQFSHLLCGISPQTTRQILRAAR